MKITYYTYYIEYENGRYLQSIHKICENFTKICDQLTKASKQDFFNSFYFNRENLYLFRISNNIYLFICTKSDEIIKTIDSDKIKATDIYERLKKNEQLGFASYIYLDEYYYGIISTFHGPKNTIWLYFLQSILDRLELNQYIICARPIAYTITRTQAMRLQIKGQTRIEVNPDNDFFQYVKDFFLPSSEIDEIKALEITIKPYRNKNLNQTLRYLDTKLKTSEGIDKYIIRAKAELEDQLTDYYIVGNKFLSDIITADNERALLQEIKNTVKDNKILKDKIDELKNDDTFIQTKIQDINRFRNIRNWDRIISSYQ